jgi:hypothetical protein
MRQGCGGANGAVGTSKSLNSSVDLEDCKQVTCRSSTGAPADTKDAEAPANRYQVEGPSLAGAVAQADRDYGDWYASRFLYDQSSAQMLQPTQLQVVLHGMSLHPISWRVLLLTSTCGAACAGCSVPCLHQLTLCRSILLEEEKRCAGVACAHCQTVTDHTVAACAGWCLGDVAHACRVTSVY